MRKFKPGFTLAEVLITLGIIGVVAAIVMPSVISSYQYKTIGVKLSKFASLVENATRPFVVQNDVFSTNDPALIEDFVNESFIITDILDVDGTQVTLPDTDANWSGTLTQNSLPDADAGEGGTAVTLPTVKLKDGTWFQVSLAPATGATGASGILDDADTADIPVDFVKVGEPVFVFDFDPKVTGLPNAIQKTYSFVVTELGYVYPNSQDNCLEAIYNADFATNARLFRDTAACTISGEEAPTPQG